jgi:hypothetical protein
MGKTRGWDYRFVAKENLQIDAISSGSVHLQSICTVSK